MKRGRSRAAPVPARPAHGIGDPATVGTRARLCLWGAAFALIYIVGVAVRLHEVFVRGYDNDALSTLYYFVGLPPLRIMTSWALPNNHALSTLLIKASIAVLGQNPLGIRLPSFLFGILIPIIAAITASIAFRSRLAALVAMAMAGGHGALIYYARVGRGYSLQSALIMGMILAVVAYERGLRGSPNGARWCRIFVLALPLAAVLTIPSSLVFIVAVMGLHVGYMALSCAQKMPRDRASLEAWIGCFLRQNSSMLACHGCVATTMVLWFALIWPMISEGQSNGVPIEGIGHFFRFSWGTLRGLKAWPAILLTIPLLVHRRYRPWGVLALLFAAISLMTAPITRGGPTRVYIPLLPVLFVSAGGGAMVAYEYIAGIGRFGRRIVAPVGAVCVLVSCLWGIGNRSNGFTLTLDFHESWFALKEAVPYDTCIFYPAERGMYLHYYDPGFATQAFGRVPRGECTVALMEARDDAATVPRVQTINGIVLTNRADVLQLPMEDVEPIRTLRFPNCAASLYPLRSVRNVQSVGNRVVLAAICSAPTDLAVEIVNTLTDGGSKAGLWCLVNPFHKPPSPSGVSIVLAAKAPPISLEGLIGLEESSGHAVRFFVIDSNGSNGN